jgi:hypothetical protein
MNTIQQTAYSNFSAVNDPIPLRKGSPGSASAKEDFIVSQKQIFPEFAVQDGIPVAEFFLCLVARTGQGKTHTIINLLRNHYNGLFHNVYLASPTLFFDPAWRESGLIDALHEAEQQKQRKFLIDVITEDQFQQLQTDIESSAKKGQRSLLVFDDMTHHPIFSSRSVDDTGRWFLQMRHRNLSVIACSHTFKSLSKWLRVNSTHYGFFPTHNQAELKDLADETLPVIPALIHQHCHQKGDFVLYKCQPPEVWFKFEKLLYRADGNNPLAKNFKPNNMKNFLPELGDSIQKEIIDEE